MANKVMPKISAPGSAKMPTKGPHNPNVGTRGSGIAPKPAGGAKLFNANASLSAQAGLARAGSVGMGNAQMLMPLQHPPANITGQKIGQQVPNTAAAATRKPNRKGGAAFYGES